MIVKYFYENTDTNYNEYNTLWGENIEKIVFLHHRLPLSEQMSCIIHEITDNKNILAIRFPTYTTITPFNISNSNYNFLVNVFYGY